MNIEEPKRNFTLLFGCDPEEGVVADTKFIDAFIKHLKRSFDSKTGTLKFPECLGFIEKKKVSFQSTSNNLGRLLEISRQNDKVGLKHLVVISKDEIPNKSVEIAV